MNPLKKLAGQTAVYGIPSIVGRILNYLLVPLYTRVFEQDEYGIVILMYSFVAVVFIILTYGMETAFFRYSELQKHNNNVYSTSQSSLLITTGSFLLLVFLFASDIARWIEYPNHSDYVVWLSLILGFDVLSAIPFARLRALNKALKFAAFKVINIATNIGFNLFFILLCPWLVKNFPESDLTGFILLFFDPGRSLIAYVFISNLLASGITFLLLLPDMLRIRLRIDPVLMKQMLIYALPMLFAGLAGVMNETLGRIMLRYLLPEDIAEAQLGIYSASYKVAILMALFIQAFRYAAEPFFFSYAREKDARSVYADMMKYFVIAISLIFLGIMLYLDVVILLIGSRFREGAEVIPILLVAYMFLGMYYNLSVWFKLTNNTKYGAMMAFAGAAVTLVLNYLLIPEMGYVGSAWATFACFGLMLVLSWLLMLRHYPIPYNIWKIILYFVTAIALFRVSILPDWSSQAYKFAFNTLLILVYVAVVWYNERKKLKKLLNN